MNRIGLALSGVVSMIGLLTFLAIQIINNTMSKMGFVAFQTAMGGIHRLNNYQQSYKSVNTGALIMVILGVFFFSFFYFRELRVSSLSN